MSTGFIVLVSLNMFTLILFSFISGLVSILAPCIWPLLPIVLSSSASGGKKKPLGIVLGIVTSFTLITLSISYIVKIFHFDAEILGFFAVFVIGILGLSLIIPSFGSTFAWNYLDAMCRSYFSYSCHSSFNTGSKYSNNLCNFVFYAWRVYSALHLVYSRSQNF